MWGGGVQDGDKQKTYQKSKFPVGVEKKARYQEGENGKEVGGLPWGEFSCIAGGDYYNRSSVSRTMTKLMRKRIKVKRIDLSQRGFLVNGRTRQRGWEKTPFPAWEKEYWSWETSTL